MTDPDTPGVEWQSSGPVLHLADGRTVRPTLSDPDGGGELVCWAVHPGTGHAVYGREVDHRHTTIEFEAVADE